MAGRIPQSFIDQLLSRIDIIDVIDKRVHLKKKGINYSACCPFHQEKTPSFSVNQQKQFYYCFGCGAHGNAIGFIMNYDRLEFVEAIEQLARSIGLEIPYEEGAKAQDSNAMLYEVLSQTQAYFALQLRQHPEAKAAVDYLKNRGLSGHIAKRYGLGYAPSGWDNVYKAIGKSEAAVEALLQAGLLVKNEANRQYDRFRHRVMFPIRDRRGRTIGFGGRVLTAEEQPKYLNSPETPVFHKGQELYGLYEAKQVISEFRHIIVVEGYMDVIALAQYGIDYAVATLGTATTPEHFKLLFKQSTTVTFCFDGDRAGRQAALRAMKVALPFMTGAYRVQFLFLPDGEDPDTIVRQEGKDAFEKRVSLATPLASFLLQFAKSQVQLNSLDGRAQLISVLLPYLKQVPEGPYRSLLCQELSQIAQLPAADIEAQIEGKEVKPQAPIAPPPELAVPRSIHALSAVEQAMVWLMQYPQFALTQAPLELPSTSAENQAFNELFALIQGHQLSHAGAILEYYQGRPQSARLAQLANVPCRGDLPNSQQEFIDILAKIQQQHDLSQLDALIAKAKSQALSEQEKEILRNLLQQNKK